VLVGELIVMGQTAHTCSTERERESIDDQYSIILSSSIIMI